jgi:uncharacterized protein (DUF305 family)
MMKLRRTRLNLTVLGVALVMAAGCASTAPAVGVSTGPNSGSAESVQPRQHTEADVAFMHGMTMHHAQALEMTSLVPDRAQNEQVKVMAQRIEVSQRDELARIERWLQRRGEPAMAASHEHAGHAGGGDQAMHPGMLTAAELARLAEARGTAFDRLFLEYMIRHHEGALQMVSTLFATEGAGEESETYQFASEVDADQRADISRMQAILQSLP